MSRTSTLHSGEFSVKYGYRRRDYLYLMFMFLLSILFIFFFYIESIIP